ncbi:MAG TPA: DUF1570 domain-containing protein [Planctomycetaceae bacterium]|nr:DUF1570 domain-containing protein [Planctomycetaceae bacterium]
MPHQPFHFDRLPRRDLLRWGLLALGTPSLTLAALKDTAFSPLSTVKWTAGKETLMRDGRILVEAQDGGLVFQSRDGQIHLIEADKIQLKATEEEVRFHPFKSEDLGRQLQEEFGFGFSVWNHGPLVVCTNTSREYANWCGELFSRLSNGFQKHWRFDKLPLTEPKFPLPVLIFATRKQFSEYALKDADASTAVSLGYYSLKTNRVAMYDITADEQGRPATSLADINRQMQKSLSNVATMVHEATHQFAFNTGLHTRYADNPLWLAEGMAMYFEVPDIRSKTGWASIGQPNKPRVSLFANWYKSETRPADSLKTLIQDDSRFTSVETAENAYAEAWGLTYYLIKRRREDYTAYLKHIAEKKILEYPTPAERIAEFEQFFGKDWDDLDEAMVSLLKNIRR